MIALFVVFPLLGLCFAELGDWIRGVSVSGWVLILGLFGIFFFRKEN